MIGEWFKSNKPRNFLLKLFMRMTSQKLLKVLCGLCLIASALIAIRSHAQSTIDAEQFCNRSVLIRWTILDQISGSSANCDPDNGIYETNITDLQLASIQKLDLRSRVVDGIDYYFSDSIKSGDFDGLTGVRIIDCNGCLFSDRTHALPGAPSEFLRQLEELYIPDRDLSEIMEVDFFKGLSNLRKLNVERNNMTYEIPPGNPNRPENTKLGRYINPEIWKHLPNLRELDIGSNRILTLPPRFFCHLKKLEILDMYDMWYEYHPYGFGSQALPAGIFECLTNLKQLILAHNALGAFPIADGFFNGLTSIEEIDLRKNPLLRTLPGSVLNLPSGVRILTDPGVTWPDNDEDKSVFSIFSTNDRSASIEEGHAVFFNIDRNGDNTSSQTVKLSVTETGSMLTGSFPTSIKFNSDETSKSLHVVTDDDSVDESDSTVQVTLIEDSSYEIRVSSASVVVRDNDTTYIPPPPPPPPPPLINRPPQVIEEAVDIVLKAGESVEIDATDHLRDPERRQLTFTAGSDDPSIIKTSVEESTVKVEGLRPGITTLTITGIDDRNQTDSLDCKVFVHRDNQVFFFPSASHSILRKAIVRVINHSDKSGEVSITAINESGVIQGPTTLSIGANSAVQFSSADLETGNPDKGFSEGLDLEEGIWRLSLESDLVIEVLSYIKIMGSLFTSMNDIVMGNEEGTYHRIDFFNPASNINKASILRLINNTDENAEVTITGIDDNGESPGSVIHLSIPANTAKMLTAKDLESGDGEGIISGFLGDGFRKWQLFVESDKPIIAMNLIKNHTGHITNLSKIPKPLKEDEDNSFYFVPLFPSAESRRQGFVRVINRSDQESIVSIYAFNNTDEEYEPLSLYVGANETGYFNSDELEAGNPDIGLIGSTGEGEGDWYLKLLSEDNIDNISVMSYIRNPEGFLTSMHNLVESHKEGTYHRIAIFNPGSNASNVSVLRVMNLSEEDAEVTVSGIDTNGESPGTEVSFTIPAGKFWNITAQELETGERKSSEIDEFLEGALGDGTGKWQLTVKSNVPVVVMSILKHLPTGHLTNISTTP